LFEITQNNKIAPDIFRLTVSAPRVAEKFQAGQFIVLRSMEDSERIPLTVLDADRDAGTITLIVKAIGFSTRKLCGLAVGDTISDLLGPLGIPSEIDLFGNVAIVGGGVGTAVAFAVAKTLQLAGNQITAILGARDQSFFILEKEFQEISEQVYPCTDDGSYGYKGFVTQRLQELLDDGVRFDRVITAGPLPMMRIVADITRPYQIKTIVSLNPIMVDGIGMCGGCRALVGGKIVFVCVDGPEFDAHQVDFESLMRRNNAYRSKEQEADHACKVDEKLAEMQSDE